MTEIEVNQVISVQKICSKFELLQTTILKHEDGWRAIIRINATYQDETSEVFDLVIMGAAFNDFWANFNSGTYIIKRVAELMGVNVKIPDEIEATFLNIIPEEPTAIPESQE
jgi:hypothetical protein